MTTQSLDHLLAGLADAGAVRVTADPDLIDQCGLALTIYASAPTHDAIHTLLSEVRRVHVGPYDFTVHATVASVHGATKPDGATDTLTLLAVKDEPRVSPIAGAGEVRARAQHIRVFSKEGVP